MRCAGQDSRNALNPAARNAEKTRLLKHLKLKFLIAFLAEMLASEVLYKTLRDQEMGKSKGSGSPKHPMAT